jgi:hypothetical protein
MSLTTVIQVAIGLALAYYALSLIVNILVAIVKDIFDMRAEALERVLADLLKTSETGQTLFQQFQEHALIQNLKPITNKAWQYTNRDRPKVEKIPNGTFSLALLDVLASRVRLTDFVYKAIGRLAKADPDLENLLRDSLARDNDNLIDGLRAAVGKLDAGPVRTRLQELIDLLLGEPDAQLKIIRLGIEELPDDTTKKALLGLISLSKDDVNDLRARVEGWYDDTMKNVSLMYTKQVRKWVIFISLLVTLLVGVDSIQIARDLWEQPARQTAVVEALSPLVDEFGKEIIELETMRTLDEAEKAQRIEERAGDILAIIAGLQSLEDVSITWQNANPLAEENWEAGIPLKVLGLLLTWGAVSQGSSFWYDIFKKLNPRAATASSSEGSTQGGA